MRACGCSPKGVSLCVFWFLGAILGDRGTNNQDTPDPELELVAGILVWCVLQPN